MYYPNSTWTWAFLLVVILQCIIALAIEGYVFGEFQASLLEGAHKHGDHAQPSGARTIPTYLALFIFGFVYQVALAYDALRAKNTIQVIGICIYNLGMLIYASVEMEQVSEAITSLEGMGDIDPLAYSHLRAYLIAAPCVIAFFTVVLAFIAWKLYAEFAWSIYKHISADLRLKRRYLTYQIYIALLKFDFFFFLGFTVQFLVVVSVDPPEKGLTIAAVPITIGLLFLAAWITRRESYIGQYGIFVIYFAGMAYFIFKLVRMYTPPKAPDYVPIRHSLTTFAVLTLILLVVTIVLAVLCMLNFNKGLRPHIQKRKVSDTNNSTGYANGTPAEGYDGKDGTAHQLNTVPHRMTID